MARRRHTPEQIIGKLREADRLLAEGADVTQVARHLEVSEQSHQPVGNQFVDMKAEDATRLKDLERENRELKRIVPDKELENRGQVTGEGAQDARTPRAGYRRPPGL
jgi:putative transposase